MRGQFKDTVTELAARDERVMLILGDVSVYMFREFGERFPGRFFNMGICENTLISVAAGLGATGFVPFVHTIAPFLTERSLEQIKLDMAYNEFGGNIVTCGASFDYAWDGPTHHAYTDLAILRLIPGVEVLQPGSRKELRSLLESQYSNGRTTYFRLSDHPHAIDIGPVTFGKARVLKTGSGGVTVMTAGPLLGNVLEACRDLDVNLVYFHTLKPMDHETVAAFRGTRILVVHDAFGLREAIEEVPNLRTSHHGLPDSFITAYGTLADIRRDLGLCPAGIRQAVTDALSEKGDRGNAPVGCGRKPTL